MPGLAAFQVERVHAHGVYDVEVDTGTTSAEDRALLVKEYLGRRTAPAAFDRLRQQASADPAGRGTP
ncbi:chloramphenicol phosphotransferase CPT family protein [Kitasatospora atroaurantiaca]|nr:chloramphenicol phosphotransferase CPT family protein [Kitasatospora atroaurantiaca]